MLFTMVHNYRQSGKGSYTAENCARYTGYLHVNSKIFSEDTKRDDSFRVFYTLFPFFHVQTGLIVQK